MPAPLFTDNQLINLYNQGLRPSEIARALNVALSTVSRRLKRIKQKAGIPVKEKPSRLPKIEKKIDPITKEGEIIHNIQPLKSPEGRLHAFDQLEHINKICNQELDFLQQNLADANALQRPILEKRQLAHIQEIRSQIKLLADIAQIMTHHQEVLEFQRIILEVLNDASPKLREKVLSKLEERAVASAIFSAS